MAGERWWRAYCGSRHDPKIMLLTPEMFRAWFILLCLAGENDGQIPSVTEAAFALRVNESKAKGIMAFLAGKELFDAVPGGYFMPHNWNGRQYKSDVSTDRVKEFRKRQGNAKTNGDETFQETTSERPQIQNTESETERKKETRASALAPDWPPDYAEQFWQAFPNKIGRKDALKRLERVGKSGKVSFTHLMMALLRYAAKTDDRPFCNPATWINQERWFDQPALSNGGKNDHSQAPGSLLKAADEQCARASAEVDWLRGESEVFERESPAITGPIPER